MGIYEPFLSEVADTVILENRDAYPELAEKSVLIKKLILVEETSFGKTIDQGLAMLDTAVENLSGDTLSGEDAFKLYDTYGFPLDLTMDILEEKGLKVDEETFDRLMKEQRGTGPRFPQGPPRRRPGRGPDRCWPITRPRCLPAMREPRTAGKVLAIVRKGSFPKR